MSIDMNNFVEAWLIANFYAINFSEREDAEWASDILNEAETSDPELCFRLVLAILEEDTSDEVVAYLAAGAIEEMLVDKGEEAISILENHPDKNGLFGKLLTGVWRNAMTEDVWERLQKLIASLPVIDEWGPYDGDE